MKYKIDAKWKTWKLILHVMYVMAGQRINRRQDEKALGINDMPLHLHSLHLACRIFIYLSIFRMLYITWCCIGTHTHCTSHIVHIILTKRAEFYVLCFYVLHTRSWLLSSSSTIIFKEIQTYTNEKRAAAAAIAALSSAIKH